MASDKNASSEVSAAIANLKESYVTLMELLARAHKTIEALDMRRALDGVRMTLVAAMSDLNRSPKRPSRRPMPGIADSQTETTTATILPTSAPRHHDGAA